MYHCLDIVLSAADFSREFGSSRRLLTASRSRVGRNMSQFVGAPQVARERLGRGGKLVANRQVIAGGRQQHSAAEWHAGEGVLNTLVMGLRVACM